MRWVEFSALMSTLPAAPPVPPRVSMRPATVVRVWVDCTSMEKAPDSASFLLLAVALTQLLKLDEMPPVLLSVAWRLFRKALAAPVATPILAEVPSAAFHLASMPSNGAYRLTSQSLFGSIWFRLCADTETAPPLVEMLALAATLAVVLMSSMLTTTAAAAPGRNRPVRHCA